MMSSDSTVERCFCELAPLYALGLLESEEREWVEQQVEACPDLIEELNQYEAAAAALPYGLEPEAIASGSPQQLNRLKTRLFAQLDLEPPELEAPIPTQAPNAAEAGAVEAGAVEAEAVGADPVSSGNRDSGWMGRVVRSKDLRWRPYPTPGVEIAILHENTERREVSGLLRAQPGVHYPFHRHAATEELYMISGDLRIGDAIYGPGDYILSVQGSVHGPWTETGCMFFFRSSMDDEYRELAHVI